MIALQELATIPTGLQAARVRFGRFELDPKSGELSSGERKTVLPRQPFQVLLLLIEHSGETVSRDEIQQRLWPDDVTVDFDIGINQAVRKLRRLLEDAADEPTYIETLGRRGYRLKLPVDWVNVSPVATSLVAEPAKHESWTPVASAQAGEYAGLELDEADTRPSLLANLPDARSLRSWLARASASQRADALEELLQIAAQIASGLQQQRAVIVGQGQAFANGAKLRQSVAKGSSAQHRFCRTPHSSVR